MSRLDIRAKTRLPAKVSYHDDSNSEEQVIIAELSLCGARIINLSYEGKDIITIKPRLPKCDEIGVRGEIVRKCDGGVATRFYFSDTSVKKKLWEYIKDNLSQSAFCPYCNHRISNGAEYCINCNFFLNYHDTAYLVKHDRETFVARLINRSHRLNVEQMRVLLNFMDTNLLREKGIALLGELVGAGQDRRDTTFPPGDLVPLGKSHRSKNRGNNRNRLYFKTIISQHPKMIQILKLIDQVADTEATVLITGESGTGKELVARELHYKSKRKDNLFLPINCGAIPENLLESELFGHVQGAFTGAVSEKPGIFKSAEGGTILLDEVSEMPTSLQVKLLRVLQSGEYNPVGSTKIHQCNVRIIAATNKDLKELVREGIFRDDLFYRLNVLDIVLPPLRDRESDIPILIQHFLKIFGIKFGKEGLHLSQEAEVLLFTYDFPGNVRELENIIQRAVVLTEGEIIETSHLPKDFYRKGAAVYHKVEHPNFKAAKQHVIEQFENEYIIDCLRSAQGNISSASRNAGMNIKNFHHKMVKYGINPQSFKKTE